MCDIIASITVKESARPRLPRLDLILHLQEHLFHVRQSKFLLSRPEVFPEHLELARGDRIRLSDIRSAVLTRRLSRSVSSSMSS